MLLVVDHQHPRERRSAIGTSRLDPTPPKNSSLERQLSGQFSVPVLSVGWRNSEAKAKEWLTNDRVHGHHHAPAGKREDHARIDPLTVAGPPVSDEPAPSVAPFRRRRSVHWPAAEPPTRRG